MKHTIHFKKGASPPAMPKERHFAEPHGLFIPVWNSNAIWGWFEDDSQNLNHDSSEGEERGRYNLPKYIVCIRDRYIDDM